MDDDIRVAFDEVLGEMRRGFAGIDQRFAGINQRFADVLLRIRETGVLIEDLRTQIQQVAEGGEANARAIERLRVEMNERFRENEIIVGGAFRQIRRDLDELRDRR